MPFCQNCGRQLAENEVCNCTANQNYTNNNFNQPPPPAPQPQPFVNNVQFEQPKKKSSVGCIIGIIVVLAIAGLFVLGIIAAILVPSMIGYTKKSHVVAANSEARSMMRSFESTLVEMDEMNYDLDGVMLISSEKSGNLMTGGSTYHDPNKLAFDVDVFENKAKEYCESLKTKKWFVVCQNGSVSYCACADGWHAKYPGTYPNFYSISDGPQFFSSNAKKKTDADLQELFDDAYIELKSRDY